MCEALCIRLLALVLLVTCLVPGLAAAEVRVMIDWQGHPAMHIPWSFFAPGLTERAPKLTWRHQFKQTVHAPYLGDSGVRIFLMAAMAAEQARNPTQARRLILRQLAYVEAFVAAHGDRYALARSASEARRLLATTDKMVVVHSIEGGHHMLSDPGDAAFWAAQGVALITLIHLRDDELGGAAILPMGIGPAINPRGAKLRRRGDRRGLTERGKEAIVELDAAGILVDLSHMTHASIDDALDVAEAHGIAPVVTHGKLARLRNTEMGFRDDQVVRIYRLGGVFSLGLDASKLDPIDPTAPVPDDVCPGTLETFAMHTQAVRDLVQAHAAEILGPAADSEEAPTRLAVGWSSDWNGWVNHSRPVYGVGRCRDASALDDPLAVDTQGLAHPGLLPSHWERLERDGLDLDPMLRSAERFLQLWEQAGD